MPNWCENQLVVSGNSEDVREFDQKFQGRRPPFLQDVEMAASTGAPPEKIRQAAQQELLEWLRDWGYRLNALYPVPEEVLMAGYSGDIPAESFGDRISKLFDPDQWWDGYSWCVSHWGTKWDLFGVNRGVTGGEAFYSFDTAWSPPVAWLQKVAEDFPHLEFELRYYEPGMGFVGIASAKGGFFKEETFEAGSDPEMYLCYVDEYFEDDSLDEPEAECGGCGENITFREAILHKKCEACRGVIL